MAYCRNSEMALLPDAFVRRGIRAHSCIKLEFCYSYDGRDTLLLRFQVQFTLNLEICQSVYRV